MVSLNSQIDTLKYQCNGIESAIEVYNRLLFNLDKSPLINYKTLDRIFKITEFIKDKLKEFSSLGTRYEELKHSYLTTHATLDTFPHERILSAFFSRMQKPVTDNPARVVPYIESIRKSLNGLEQNLEFYESVLHPHREDPYYSVLISRSVIAVSQFIKTHGIILYKDVEELGSGTTGVVYKAELDGIAHPFALKTSRETHSGEWLYLYEGSVRIQQLASSFFTNTEFVINHNLAMEIGNTTLDHLIESSAPEDLSLLMTNLPNFVKQLLQSLSIFERETLCGRRVLVHRDIKPANMVITQDDRLKLIDYNCVVEERSDPEHVTTEWYASPEYCRQLPSGPVYCITDDLWSLGASLFESLAGMPLVHYIPKIPLPTTTEESDALDETITSDILSIRSVSQEQINEILKNLETSILRKSDCLENLGFLAFLGKHKELGKKPAQEKLITSGKALLLHLGKLSFARLRPEITDLSAIGEDHLRYLGLLDFLNRHPLTLGTHGVVADRFIKDPAASEKEFNNSHKDSSFLCFVIGLSEFEKEHGPRALHAYQNKKALQVYQSTHSEVEYHTDLKQLGAVQLRRLMGILNGLLQVDPAKRLTAHQLYRIYYLAEELFSYCDLDDDADVFISPSAAAPAAAGAGAPISVPTKRKHFSLESFSSKVAAMYHGYKTRKSLSGSDEDA